MATWNQIKTDTQALIDKKQRIVDFYSDTSDSDTWNFKVFTDADDDTGLGFSWTGSGGATAYWNAWRTANPTLDGSNGNAHQNIWYEMWSEFQDSHMYQDTNAKSIGEIIAIQQAELTEYEGVLADAQAQIDAGNGDVDPSA